MKKRRINYSKYFCLFFAIAVLVFIAGCAGAPPIVPIINSVTYDGNGHTAGTVPLDPASPYESGATVTVLGNTGDLTRINDGGTSYYFVCWNTKADCSGTAQGEGDTFTMGESNVTLYAQWKSYVLRGTGPAGGLIFYVKEGGYTNGWRYFEAAPVSTEWTVRLWGSSGTLIGGTETGIGAGQVNTDLIVAAISGEADRAAQLCDDLSIVNNSITYNDWFLPSKDELNLMYENLKVSGVGGFAVNGYWSSSEYGVYHAWYQYFDGGYQGYGFTKDNTYRVRAVRAF